MGQTLAAMHINGAEVCLNFNGVDFLNLTNIFLRSGISCVVTVLLPEDGVTQTLLLFLLSKLQFL